MSPKEKQYTMKEQQIKTGWNWISEEEYKKALCVLYHYVFEADFLNDTFYSAKDDWKELFGEELPRSYEELYERACKKCHPDDRERVCRIFSIPELNRAWNRGEKKCSVECRIKIKGDYKWFHCTVILFGDKRGHLRGVIGCGRDRNTRKEEEVSMRYQATHDALTDTWNWRAGSEILEDYMELEMASQAAFVLIHIEKFKELNDEYGYLMGEQILKQVVAVLQPLIPEESYLIRYSGEEFILFLEIDNAEQIRQLLNQMQESMLVKLKIDTINGRIPIKTIMGVSLYPKHGKTTERLLECANYAMRTVNSDLRNRYALYDRSMEVKVEEHQLLREEDRIRWENLEDIVYISDPITHELYYVNKIGRKYFGIDHTGYQGRKCYEVMQGKPSPCSFCKKCQLEEGETILWEHTNEKLNRRFLVRDRLFRRNGQLIHVELAIDISERKD